MREGLAVRYVGRLIRLAFVASEIVESIVKGRQPATLTAEALTRRIELPLSWCSQKSALNVSSRKDSWTLCRVVDAASVAQTSSAAPDSWAVAKLVSPALLIS